MKKEKIKLFKLFYFNSYASMYMPLEGLFSSVEDFFDKFKFLYGERDFNRLHVSDLIFIKIPFFGYHSPQFTALDPRGLAVNEKPEV